jgi:Ni,Fe-hydrogenase maturation factor
MTIFVFGNSDLSFDSLPLRILPKLREEFPNIQFEVKDPNEEWDIPEELIILDTVISGDDTSRTKEVTVFDDIDKFTAAPRVSMHDFDALANIRLLKKLGKIKKIKIIGVPPDMDEREVVEKVRPFLKKSDLFN